RQRFNRAAFQTVPPLRFQRGETSDMRISLHSEKSGLPKREPLSGGVECDGGCCEEAHEPWSCSNDMCSCFSNPVVRMGRSGAAPSAGRIATSSHQRV